VRDEKVGGRRRAVGTRDRVMSHLLVVGEVTDAGGMASTALAEAVAYPGSSIAFAQLLSGMERSGLIEREVRGKRTYRITPTKSAVAQARSAAVPPRAGRAAASARSGARVSATHGAQEHGAQGHSAQGHSAQGHGAQEHGAQEHGAQEFDYDELARRLLLEVVQRLGAPGQGREPAADGEPGEEADDDASLARTVASLEQKLASVRSKQRRLAEENAQLREQLRAAQESLAQAQERADAERVAGRLDSAEVNLLERLLSPLRDKGAREEEAGTG
jgi:outer membrane murein-binding lipoprotein Lpp